MRRSAYSNRRKKLSDIGLRWCLTCARETKFRWSPSENTYVCELCKYEKAMRIDDTKLLKSEQEFMKELEKL